MQPAMCNFKENRNGPPHCIETALPHLLTVEITLKKWSMQCLNAGCPQGSTKSNEEGNKGKSGTRKVSFQDQATPWAICENPDPDKVTLLFLFLLEKLNPKGYFEKWKANGILRV